jgi:beta-galactosidase
MLFAGLGLTMPYDAWIDAPEQVETILREKDGRQYLFVLNYLKTEAELYLKRPMRNVLTGTTDENITVLPPYGVAVYTLL